ncbi:hypothetical protein LBMAG52_42640 [Planctomycetia bacterium]|nr:hypothetical protein LBMAG52_42640 [Planctomycetia bacterium]
MSVIGGEMSVIGGEMSVIGGEMSVIGGKMLASVVPTSTTKIKTIAHIVRTIPRISILNQSRPTRR